MPSTNPGLTLNETYKVNRWWQLEQIYLNTGCNDEDELELL